MQSSDRLAIIRPLKAIVGVIVGIDRGILSDETQICYPTAETFRCARRAVKSRTAINMHSRHCEAQSVAVAGCAVQALVMAWCVAVESTAVTAKEEKTPIAAGTSVEIRLPADHQKALGDQGQLLAVDLTHGDGTGRLSVGRIWTGEPTVNTGFGPGWGDMNLVRLTMIQAKQILVWRGGQGCARLAIQLGETFETTDRATISQNKDGWVMQTRDGVRLTFDSKGRLTSEDSGAGVSRTYAYDSKGRLASVMPGPRISWRIITTTAAGSYASMVPRDCR